jgi:hypothetical protein
MSVRESYFLLLNRKGRKLQNPLFIASAVVLLFTIAHPAQGQTTISAATVQLNVGLLNLLPPPTTTDPPGSFKHVQPSDFDPGKTYLVQSAWLSGMGCPTNATIALPNATFTGVGGFGSYTDPACPTGDPNDHHNEGLLLVKTGPTNNFASATAELINVKGITLAELGYDIRKNGATHASPLGSHCGAGAPRFDIVTTTDFFFLGCSSPPPDMETPGDGWIRLRWGGTVPLMGFSATTFTLMPITGTVQRIVIVFDEGTDTGPDFFGAAILDNIDVNGTLVGEGPVTAN